MKPFWLALAVLMPALPVASQERALIARYDAGEVLDELGWLPGDTSPLAKYLQV